MRSSRALGHIKVMKYLNLALLLLLCVGWTSPILVEVEHYVGTIQTSSADGKTPYGPARGSVVKRVVDPERGTIVETVFDGDSLRKATLRQRGKTAVLDASDTEKSFTGTLTFSGPKIWSPTGWRYQLVVKKGDWHITGEAQLTKTGMNIQKLLAPGKAAPTVRITETYKRVKGAVFIAELARLQAEVAKQKAKP